MKATFNSIAVILILMPQALLSQWQKQLLPLAPFEDLYGISFLTDKEFYICSNTEISHTVNGGASWEVKNLLEGAPFIPFLTNTLHDLHFFDGSNGIATGVFNIANNEIVIRTDDGNQNWSQAYLNTSILPPAYFNDLDVWGQTVLICGINGRIIRSIDGGQSFTSVANIPNVTFSDILFLDSNRAIALSPNKVFRSSNGGISWAADLQFEGKGATCISRANAHTLYMISDGRLLRSTDNGVSFAAATTQAIPGGAGKIAATNDTILISNTLGICISVNGGAYWQQFKNTKEMAANRLHIYNGKAYALCDASALYTLDMSDMAPAPIAFFELSVQQECGKTTMSATSAVDTSHVFSYWFLNGMPFGNGTAVQKAYTSFTPTSQTLSLVVADKLTQQSDTLTQTVGIPFWEKAEIDLGPDQYLCYDARGQVNLNGHFVSVETVTQGIIDVDLTYNWSIHTPNTIITFPLKQDTQLVLTAWIDQECPIFDTVQFFVSGAYVEHFHFSDPQIPFLCGNSSCAVIPDIQLMSEKIGYGIATDGYFLKTTDGGKTWAKNQIGNSFYSYSRGSVDFIDENIGFTTGPNRKTTDGGQTFTPLNAPHNIYGQTDIVDFINPDTGIYVVSSPFSPGFSNVFKTEDGGQTFQEILTCYFVAHEVKYELPNTIFVAGGYTNGILLRSANGGISWDTIPIPHPKLTVWSVDAIGTDTIFVHNGAYIERTYNGGLSWHSSFISSAAGKVSMLNSQVGYASAGNHVLKTENGGDCWTKVFTAEYPSIHAIAFDPTGSAFFFTADDHSSPVNGPVIYHTRYYREFAAEVPPVTCAGSPTRTRNKSFGYTHYYWFLDGHYFGTGYDVAFKIEEEGLHVFKLVADSAGLYRDSVELAIFVRPKSGSLGAIEGPNELCGTSMFTTSYELPQMDNFVHYYWTASDYPNLIPSMSGSANNNRFFTFSSWPGTGKMTLEVYAVDTLGCSSDTSSMEISVINAIPPSPAYLEMSEYCHYIGSSDIAAGGYVDSITFNAAFVAGVSQYTILKDGWAFGTFSTPNGSAPSQIYCVPDVAVFKLYHQNACGLSAGYAADTLVTGYQNILGVSHTQDTVIQAGTWITLFAHVELEPFFQSICLPLKADWFFQGQPMGWQAEYVSFIAAPQMEGQWTAKIYNGCDTLSFDFHLGIITDVEDPQETKGQLFVAPNPNNGSFSVSWSQQTGEGSFLRIVSASGAIVSEIPVQPSAAFQIVSVEWLPEGLYWVQLIHDMSVNSVGRFARH